MVAQHCDCALTPLSHTLENGENEQFYVTVFYHNFLNGKTKGDRQDSKDRPTGERSLPTRPPFPAGHEGAGPGWPAGKGMSVEGGIQQETFGPETGTRVFLILLPQRRALKAG